MNAKDIENEYTLLWKKIALMPEPLQKIYWDNWDESGRAKGMNVEVDVITAILKKNAAAGYPGFKLDMNTIFEKEAFSETQLKTYFKVFLAGSQYIADKISDKNIETKKIKP